MTKRYREDLEEVVTGEAARDVEVDDPRGVDAPTSFRWRGRSYTVLQVLGHWREDAGWWRRPDGVPVQLERTDLWRVEARNGVGPGGKVGNGAGPGGRKRDGAPAWGVYELVRRGETWRLDRVWD